MTTIPQLPTVTAVGPSDLVPLSQGGVLYAASIAQITDGLQTEIVLPTGAVLGRASVGAGEPEALSLGAGLVLGGTVLAATGTDHLGFDLASSFAIGDEVIVNAGGAPTRLPMPALRGLFAAGTGIAIDPNGTLSVTTGAIAGPSGPPGPAGSMGPQGVSGPAGPPGAGLLAPATGNAASTIAGNDYIAIWQNGTNAWISYQQLIGGQTIDQLPAAGPAADTDQLLVAQGGNALSSQSFSAIWTYAALKIPTMRAGVVELTADTVLDATSHNQRVLVVSEPITLSANFANLESGFSCRVINLSGGVVTMGIGIVSGSGSNVLPPGASADIVAITYSGGSIVWWNGVASVSPTITVGPITVSAPNAAFTIGGGLFDDAPTMLDYSFDSTQWTAAAGAIIGAASYQFQAPGLAAGTYAVMVRDHGNPTVVGTSASFTIADAIPPAITIVELPSTIADGAAITISGTVIPGSAAVQVGLSGSSTVAPESFVGATVVGTSWSATLTAGADAGMYYVWSEQTDNSSIQAISNAINVTTNATGIIYTVNQPAVLTVAAGSGSLALNGGVTPPQTTPTKIAFSTSDTLPPTTGWQTATIIDNNSVWAIYATAPSIAGDYYVWVETVSGLNAAVSSFSITVT
jgi:hypothetical protein